MLATQWSDRSMPDRAHHLEVTPPMFGITFGIAGLSNAWRVAGQHWATVAANLLAVVSAALAVALVIPWLTQLARRESQLSTELSDPVLGPSVPAIAISAMLVSAPLMGPAYTLAKTLVAIFAFLTVAGGLAVVITWLARPLPLRLYQPGFYLPTAGGTLLSAQCVTLLGWIGLAQALFFVGLVSWLVLAVVTSLRLIRAPLAPSLRPVMAIEIAAPALAGNTYLVVFDRYDAYALALTATTILMGIVQLALTPYYRRAPFGPAFWTAAFSYATTAALALRWINYEHPLGAVLWRALTLALATGVVVALSGATLAAVRRGLFLQRRTPVRHSLPDRTLSMQNGRRDGPD
jgi:tellurite resistance protein